MSDLQTWTITGALVVMALCVAAAAIACARFYNSAAYLEDLDDEDDGDGGVQLPPDEPLDGPGVRIVLAEPIRAAVERVT